MVGQRNNTLCARMFLVTTAAAVITGMDAIPTTAATAVATPGPRVEAVGTPGLLDAPQDWDPAFKPDPELGPGFGSPSGSGSGSTGGSGRGSGSDSHPRPASASASNHNAPSSSGAASGRPGSGSGTNSANSSSGTVAGHPAATGGTPAAHPEVVAPAAPFDALQSRARDANLGTGNTSGSGSEPSSGSGSTSGSGTGRNAGAYPRSASGSHSSLNSPRSPGSGGRSGPGSGTNFAGSSSGPTSAELGAGEKATRDAAIQGQRQAHARAIAEHLAAVRAAHAQAAAARQTANAARRAEHLALAAASTQTIWARTGQPNQLIIVRARNIDEVTSGHLTTRIVHAPGPLTLAALAKYLPPRWLTFAGDGSAQLFASIALTADTSLDNGPEVRTLRLAAGTTAASAASIWVSHGRLTLHNVTLTSVDARTGQARTTPAPARGFIHVGSGGILNIADAALANLGTASPTQLTPSSIGSAVAAPSSEPSVGSGQRAGVVFAPGSTGSIIRSTLDGNGVGLMLSGSHDVRLDTIMLTRSHSVGLILHGDRGTLMRALHSEDNAGDGVIITGLSTDRPLTDINAVDNGGFGVAVIRQDHPQITSVTTSHNRAGGLRLTASTAATVASLTTTDEPVGLMINGVSNHLDLSEVHTQGGQRGIVFTHAVSDVELRASSVKDAALTGLTLAATNTRLKGVSIQDSAAGIQINSRATHATIADSSIVGGRDGVLVARGAATVAISNPTIDGVSHNAITTTAAGTHITGGRITGGAIAINARAATDISGLSISGVREGVHAGPRARATGGGINVRATSSGIKVDPAGEFILTDSHVQAWKALRGDVTLIGVNTISLPPFNWLGAFGVFFITLAVLLELAQLTRERRQMHTSASTAAGEITLPGASGESPRNTRRHRR